MSPPHLPLNRRQAAPLPALTPQAQALGAVSGAVQGAHKVGGVAQHGAAARALQDGSL